MKDLNNKVLLNQIQELKKRNSALKSQNSELLHEAKHS